MQPFNKQNIPYNLITILGPTATGKTSLAANLAYRINGEIISADSRQIYRGMDIGTGKDIEDYTVNNTLIPFHLIDIADAGYKYNVFEYQKDFVKVFNDILERGKIPILCGGSGLYIEAVLKGYKLLEVPPNEPLRKELAEKSLEELSTILSSMRKLHNVSEFDTKKRVIRAIEIEKFYHENSQSSTDFPKINSILFGIEFDRSIKRKRISDRLEQRLKNSMITEVESLIKKGIPADDLIYYGLEYKFVTQYLIGDLSYDEMFKRLEIAIHQFLKRQDTWFRRMERNGMKIHWIDGNLSMEEKLNFILQLI